MSTNKANRLIHEKSPYLLQHAYNPVNWYPWSDEAFEKAKAEDKPIFLSIGYSTCHWCHVMERESFEDEEVADLLNRYFISIKVDREERPDIDSIYMNVCQMLTGSGGWPLTIFMTPEAKPFFAGTYFPKNDKMGMMGLISLLNNVRKAWESKKDELIKAGEEIANMLASDYDRTGNIERGSAFRNINYGSADNAEIANDLPYKDIIDNAYNSLKRYFDKEYGGFGRVPKFPTPHNLYFLLRYWYATGEKHALEMVEKTLECMYRGGIYDHIGFGFSRYSTDNKWLIPHFEKMLYDNALISIAYIEAYQATGNKLYADIAEQVFAYVLRDMTSPEGGFYSAEDADSEGVEGKFYLWTPEEVKEVLGEEDGEKFCSYYDITEDWNFEYGNVPNLVKLKNPIGKSFGKTTGKDKSTGDKDNGKNNVDNVDYVDNNADEEYNADEHNMDEEFIEKCRMKLFEYREKRIRPHKDDKILTSWNSLMIASMAIGGRVLKNNSYTKAAEKAAGFILSALVDKNGRLMARYRQGDVSYPGYIDDYAFFIWALIELYETTFNPVYLKKAISFSEDMIRLFWDNKNGGFFFYGSDSERLIARPKEVYDGAMPSGNSVAALNFVRLAKLTGNQELGEMAFKILKAFEEDIENALIGHTFMLCSLMHYYQPSYEVVIVTDSEMNGEACEDRECRDMIDIVRQIYNPFLSVILYSKRSYKLGHGVNNDKGSENEQCSENERCVENGWCELIDLGDIIPHVKQYKTLEGKTTAYVCRNFSCRPPVTDGEKLKMLLMQER